MEDLSIPNESLAKHLFEIAEFYKIENDTYRHKTFNEAAQKIELYPDEIISGQDAKDKIGKGVGPSTMDVIDEFSTKGTSKRLEDLRVKHADRVKVIDEFMKVHGIGPVTANKYYDLGFRTIDDLWHNAPLTDAQKLAIYYYDHLKHRIPRDEIDWINKYLHILFPQLQIEIVGSYRRGETTSGDIDILIKRTSNINLSEIVQVLKDKGIIIGNLALGQSKYLGLIRIGERPVRRLDLLLIAPESWASALLYFTGSQRFNILTRNKAKELGMRLNEYGLHNNKGERLLTNTEADIFNLLQIRYFAPNERTRFMVNLF